MVQDLLVNIKFENKEKLKKLFPSIHDRKYHASCYLYINTLYIIIEYADRCFFISKYQILEESNLEIVDFSIDVYNHLFSILEDIGNNIPIELQIANKISDTDRKQELHLYIVAQDNDEPIKKNIPINQCPSQNDSFDFSEICGEDSLFRDVAEVKSEDWNELINVACLSSDYEIGTIPEIDFENNSTIAIHGRWSNQLYYEGVNSTQAYWGDIPAKVIKDRIETQVSNTNIALTAFLMNGSNIKLSDDCFSIKIETDKGAVIFPRQEIVYRVADIERKFQFIIYWSYCCRLKPSFVDRLIDWLPISQNVKLKLDNTGLIFDKGSNQLLISKQKFQLDTLIEIELSSNRIKKSLQALRYKYHDSPLALQKTIRLYIDIEDTPSNYPAYGVSFYEDNPKKPIKITNLNCLGDEYYYCFENQNTENVKIIISSKNKSVDASTEEKELIDRSNRNYLEIYRERRAWDSLDDWINSSILNLDLKAAAISARRLKKNHYSDEAHDIAHTLIIHKTFQTATVDIVRAIPCAEDVIRGLTNVELPKITKLCAEMVYQIAVIYNMAQHSSKLETEILTVFGLALIGEKAIEAGIACIGYKGVTSTLLSASSKALMIFAIGNAARIYYQEQYLAISGELNILKDASQNYLDGITDELAVEELIKEEIESEFRIDYTQLEEYLKRGKWKKADIETGLIIKHFCRIFGCDINVDLLKNIPKNEILKLDTLWSKYSNGKFGFGIQKKIYKKTGKNIDLFGEKVGWYIDNGWFSVSFSWISYYQIIFSLDSHKGHLPAFWLDIISDSGKTEKKINNSLKIILEREDIEF